MNNNTMDEQFGENVTEATEQFGNATEALPALNNNNVDSSQCLLYNFIFQGILMGIFCIFGIVGNTVAFTVFQIDTLKTSTTFLFQGLALTDTLLLITTFPVYCIEAFLLYTKLGVYYYHNIHGYIIVYVYPWSMIFQTATIWLTVLVAVNRYIAVCRPYQAARLCSVSKAKRHLACVIICAIIYNIPRLFSSRIKFIYVDKPTGVGNETIKVIEFRLPYNSEFADHGLYDIIYNNILYTVLMLFLPLLTLTILNILLVVTLNGIKRKRAVMQTRVQQQDNNATLVLIIVIFVFTVCQTPALINQILWSVSDEEAPLCGTVHNYFRRICNLLVIINSSVNFIIYFAFNSRFKQNVLTRVCCIGTEAKRRISTNGTTCQTLLTSRPDADQYSRFVQNGQITEEREEREEKDVLYLSKVGTVQSGSGDLAMCKEGVTNQILGDEATL